MNSTDNPSGLMNDMFVLYWPDWRYNPKWVTVNLRGTQEIRNEESDSSLVWLKGWDSAVEYQETPDGEEITSSVKITLSGGSR